MRKGLTGLALLMWLLGCMPALNETNDHGICMNKCWMGSVERCSRGGAPTREALQVLYAACRELCGVPETKASIPQASVPPETNNIPSPQQVPVRPPPQPVSPVR